MGISARHAGQKPTWRHVEPLADERQNVCRRDPLGRLVPAPGAPTDPEDVHPIFDGAPLAAV